MDRYFFMVRRSNTLEPKYESTDALDSARGDEGGRGAVSGWRGGAKAAGRGGRDDDVAISRAGRVDKGRDDDDNDDDDDDAATAAAVASTLGRMRLLAAWARMASERAATRVAEAEAASIGWRGRRRGWSEAGGCGWCRCW